MLGEILTVDNIVIVNKNFEFHNFTTPAWIVLIYIH